MLRNCQIYLRGSTGHSNWSYLWAVGWKGAGWVVSFEGVYDMCSLLLYDHSWFPWGRTSEVWHFGSTLFWLFVPGPHTDLTGSDLIHTQLSQAIQESCPPTIIKVCYRNSACAWNINDFQISPFQNSVQPSTAVLWLVWSKSNSDTTKQIL